MALGAPARYLGAIEAPVEGEFVGLYLLLIAGGVTECVELADARRDYKDVVNFFRQQATVQGKLPDFILDVVGFAVEYFGDEVEHFFREFAVEGYCEVFVGEHFVEGIGLADSVVAAEGVQERL